MIRGWQVQPPRRSATATRSRSSTTVSGCTSGSRWASARSRRWCWPAAWWRPTRRSGAGGPSSDRS